MTNIRVLSLFDGISCARVALDKLGYSPEYYASEIDKYAIKVASKNYPDTIHIGDVRNVSGYDYAGIDLLIGGSPCQDLSIAKANRRGLDGDKSGLFWKYVRILREAKPKYFVLENVNSMPKKDKATITEALRVEPIMIDAALVSAQRRRRLFWTNIPNITLPEDKGILLRDIIEESVWERVNDKWICWLMSESGQKRRAKGHIARNPEKSLTLMARTYANWSGTYILQTPRGNNSGGLKAIDGKTPTLSASSWEHNNHLAIMNREWLIRKLTPIECERLQCLPDEYTDGVSDRRRYMCLGNAFNVDVVMHILANMEVDCD